MEEKYIEILEQAVEKYGKEAQVYQTVEEMSELKKEKEDILDFIED